MSMTVQEFLANKDSLFASQTWGSGFGLSDEKNNRRASANAIYLDTGNVDIEAARQEIQELQDLLRSQEGEEYPEVTEQDVQQAINRYFPETGVIKTPSLRTPDNPKFYDQYQYVTDPSDPNFGMLKYIREREKNWEGISGDKILRAGVGLLGAFVPALSPVVSTLAKAESAAKAVSSGDVGQLVAGPVAGAIAGQVVNQILPTAFGQYLENNNLTSDFTTATSRFIEDVASGKDIDSAAMSALGTYVREGGGIGGEAEQGIAQALGGVGRALQPVLSTLSPVGDVVKNAVNAVGDIAQDVIIDPVVAAGDVFADITQGITNPLTNDLLNPLGDFAQDVIIDPLVAAGDVAQDIIIDPVVAGVTAAGDVAQDVIIDPLVAAGDVAQDVIIDPLVAAGSSVDDALQPLYSGIGDILSGIGDLFSGIQIPDRAAQRQDMRTTTSLFGDDLFKFHTEIETPTIGRLFSGLV